MADTSTVVSGLLWRGPSRQVLDAARDGEIELFTSAVLLIELEEVLLRPKFAERLEKAAVEVRELVLGYAVLAKLADPAAIAPTIRADPDDDAVLACAVGARAEAIVTGDNHLLRLKSFREIRIRTASELLALLDAKRGAEQVPPG